jgi:hypothetical protein
MVTNAYSAPKMPRFMADRTGQSILRRLFVQAHLYKRIASGSTKSANPQILKTCPYNDPSISQETKT